jgi:hypothetical protein
MQRPQERRIYKAVYGQWFGKDVPAATDTSAIIYELCFLCGPCRDVLSNGQCDERVEFCMRGVKIGPECMKLKNL